MAIEFKFPDVGEGIHEGELKKWLVKEGDKVAEHQTIAEIETDKAVVEIPSPASGIILKLNAKQGDVVNVGQVLVVIGEKGEKVDLKKEEIKREQKAEVKAEAKKKSVSVIGELEEAPEDEEEKPEEESEVEKSEEEKVEKKEIRAIPAARKQAKESGIDLSQVHGTGQDGVITVSDVNAFAKSKPEANFEEKEASHALKVSFEEWGPIIRLPLKGMRKTIAQNMIKSIRTAVHVTHMDDVDVTELAKIREQKKSEAENKGFPLTFLPFVVKACIIALKEHPFVNSSLIEETQEIVLKKYYNMGIAVDTPEGLMVPVIKNADKKSILEIAKDIFRLAEEARTREIQIKDLRGSSFTITNIGSLGGIFATPIINQPEIAILGLGRMKETPVVRDGNITIRKIMPLSLSFDHRVIDGAEAAKFVNDIKKHLEDPTLMLIEE